ncbi:MAG: hypothetical protein Q7S22_01865 [Candidatus Micrarchaeota archaeon]|nr:hypothetical protein [Candidatus Micrarchaeota archaeon]
MQLIGSFFEFANRVMSAAKQGKLPKDDSKKLERLLTRTAKRNTVLAKGILTALNAGGAKADDIKRFSQLLEKANDRISQDKNPFTDKENTEISDIFKSAYISTKAAHWFASQIDELVAEEIDEYIKGRRFLAVPTKKVVMFESAKKVEKETNKMV